MKLISLLRKHGYEIGNYHSWEEKQKCVILRHDIDYSIDLAVKMAEKEADGGVLSTWFVILTSNLYNAFSNGCKVKLRRILELGHEIGVHYDEMAYPDDIGDQNKMIENIIREGMILSNIIERPVSTFSMHRPSKRLLEANLEIPGFVNSYSDIFFHDFKYVSDSRRRWREPVEMYVENETYDKLHILTHAFWYGDDEKNIHDSVLEFIRGGTHSRYESMKDHITWLDSVLLESEI